MNKSIRRSLLPTGVALVLAMGTMAGTAAASSLVTGGKCNPQPMYYGTAYAQSCVSVHTGTTNPIYGDGYVRDQAAGCTAYAVIVVNGSQVASGPVVSCSAGSTSVHIPAATYYCNCGSGSKAFTQLIIRHDGTSSIDDSPTMYY